MNPHKVTEDFENAVAEYCGAPYAVAVNSCSNALFLAVWWCRHYGGHALSTVQIPKRTYVSVPMQVQHAGASIEFCDVEWRGLYQLAPLPVWDSARFFSSGMYRSGQFICTSHHWSKTLGIQQGGMILCDDVDAVSWFRRARFDGRTPGVAPAADTFDQPGWHMYMSPEVAAEGLVRLAFLPKHNEPLPNDDYPDLSTAPIFKRRNVA